MAAKPVHSGFSAIQTSNLANNSTDRALEAKFFRSLLPHVRFQGFGTMIYSAVAGSIVDQVRTAGDRTGRRRLNKLSCAGWLPHDRGFVSGLPCSRPKFLL